MNQGHLFIFHLWNLQEGTESEETSQEPVTIACHCQMIFLNSGAVNGNVALK